MTNNIEGNNTGLNVVTKQDPAPLPTSRHSKLTPQLKFFLERKFVSYLDWHLEVSIESFGKNQASWKACSRWHKAFGFNMLKPRAKVLKLFTRHCWSSSSQVWCNAKLKLLDAATDSLCIDMEAHQEEIQDCEKDIDAQWKSHLAKVKEITSDQVDDLVKSVASGRSYFIT